MSVQLPDGAKALIDGKTFVVVATVEPSGQPQLSTLWVTRDGDDLLLSTTVGRRKHKNLLANPQITVAGYNPENPYNYFEVRGTATITEEGGRELIDDLCEKYRGMRPYPGDQNGETRVVIRISADKALFYG